MQCSICEKMFAASLSVCPSCGAMQTQFNQAESSLRLLSIEKINTSDLQLEIADASPTDSAPLLSENEFYAQSEHQQTRRGQTTTLLEFPSKISKDQEWREEIKNRIRERQEGSSSAAAVKKAAKPGQSTESSLVINLKPKLAEKQSPKSKDVVAEALKRIERSRKKFENDELNADELAKISSQNVLETTSKKQSETLNSTLTLVPARKVLPMIEDDELRRYEDKQPTAKTSQKGVFTVPLKVPAAAPKSKNKVVCDDSAVFDDLDDEDAIAASLESVRKTSIRQTTLKDQELSERLLPSGNTRRQSNEDYAPLVPRLIAGAIDLLICGVCAFGLSHFVIGATITSGWLLTGIAFAAILFVYLTVALQLTDTTLGLRLFGMFVVAAEDGDAPSVSQTSISNAVYLLTLATAGVGLLTVFFGSERRALHDLLSGTVVVKE